MESVLLIIESMYIHLSPDLCHMSNLRYDKELRARVVLCQADFFKFCHRDSVP